MLVRESSVPIHDRRLTNSADCETLIRTYLAGIDREHFVILLVNRKNEVIGINTVSIGSLTASVVSPREVFKPVPFGQPVRLGQWEIVLVVSHSPLVGCGWPRHRSPRTSESG
jgi:hypothetical protein